MQPATGFDCFHRLGCLRGCAPARSRPPFPIYPGRYKHYFLSPAPPRVYNSGMHRPYALMIAPMWLLAGALFGFGIHGSSALGQTAPSGAPAAVAESPAPAIVIGIHGEIDDYNKDAFERRFATARADGAKVVIVQIDTYGGLVTAGLDISRFIKNQTDIHTIAYVNTKAISAGAMIAMACDEIVMADNAALGDCAPISVSSGGQLEPLPPAERAKMESPILADFRDSAIRNRHDPLLAEAMVSVDTVVYWMQSPTGEKRFVGEKGMKELMGQGWKPVDPGLNPVDSDTTLLTVHTPLAIQLGLATGQASNLDQLAADHHLQITSNLEPGAGEAVLDWLNDGVVRMTLLIVFCISLYIILHAPGHGMAEVVAMCSLALVVGVPLLTGYATWWEILIIFVGLGLIAVEIFVLPHAGLMLLLGSLMMVGGFVMTFVGREPGFGPGLLPHLPQTWMALEHGLFFVVAALLCSAALCWWLSRYLPSLPILNRLILTATSGGGAGPQSVAQANSIPAPTWPVIGMVGRAVTPLRPGGSVEFYNEFSGDSRIVIAQSESGYIAAGTSVIVHENYGNRVKVRAL